MLGLLGEVGVRKEAEDAQAVVDRNHHDAFAWRALRPLYVGRGEPESRRVSAPPWIQTITGRLSDADLAAVHIL